MSEVNVSSFMQVISATQEDDRGLLFPAELMPAGKPVRSDGVTKQMLMTSKSIAEGWHDAIRSEHARQEEERDHVRSVKDVPSLTIRGGDSLPTVNGAVGGGQKTTVQTVEEELQQAYETAKVELSAMEESQKALANNIIEAYVLMVKLNNALNAMKEAVPNDEDS